MSDPAPALRVIGIEKSFPGVQALKRASLDVHRGEIHGLVGENGAGKSTLMRVLAGVFRPTAGEILLDEKPVQFASPRDAQDHGIAMVYQDTRLVPDLDVAQNIWLGREPGNRFFVDRRRMEASAREILDRLGLRIRLDASVRSLAFDERQIVEIARALTTDPPFLILDEPTSGLDRGETERLFVILRQLRAAGKSLIFISHRLPEVLSLVDRITVMKDGEVVGTVAHDAVDQDRLVSMMVGRSMTVAYPPRAAAAGETRLEVDGLSSLGRLENVSFSVAAGEIVGLGGIVGNGQTDIVRSLFGLIPSRGRVELDGEAVRLGSPRQAIASGIIYVPADRRREGLFLVHSIRENISVPYLGRWSRFGVIATRAGAAGDSGGDPRFRGADAVRRTAGGVPERRQSAESDSGPLDAGDAENLHVRRADPGRRCRNEARNLSAPAGTRLGGRRGCARFLGAPRTHRSQRPDLRDLGGTRRRRGRRRRGDRRANHRRRDRT